MLTMRPRPLLRRAGRAKRVRRSVDIKVSSHAACQALSSKSSKPPAGGPPGLLTRMRSPPNRWGGECRGARPQALDLCGRFFEHVLSPSEERDIAALAREREGARTAHPRR